MGRQDIESIGYLDAGIHPVDGGLQLRVESGEQGHHGLHQLEEVFNLHNILIVELNVPRVVLGGHLSIEGVDEVSLLRMVNIVLRAEDRDEDDAHGHVRPPSIKI